MTGLLLIFKRKYGFVGYVDYEQVDNLSSPISGSAKARAQITSEYYLTIGTENHSAYLRHATRSGTVFSWLQGSSYVSAQEYYFIGIGAGLKVAFRGNESELDQQFAARLSNCTELELVMLTAIAVEHEIDQFIILIVPQAQYLKDVKIDFVNKVGLALSLGMTSELKGPLNSIGTIRNNFAHTWEAKLNKCDVDNFVNTFTKEHQAHAIKLHDKLKAASKLRPFKEPFDNLKLNDKFLLNAVVLRSAVRAVRKDVERLNPIIQDFLAINPNSHRE